MYSIRLFVFFLVFFLFLNPTSVQCGETPVPSPSPPPSPSPGPAPCPTPTKEPLTPRQIASRIAGGASIACWIFVTAPQIYKNWKNSTAEAIAFAFIMCWVLGDLTNFLGCILTHQLLTQTALAGYYILIDAVMVSQILYYKVRDSKRKYATLQVEEPHVHPPLTTSQSALGTAVVGTMIQKGAEAASMTLTIIASARSSSTGDGDDPCNTGSSESRELEILGITFAWTSATLYLSSRLPQIYKNFRRKSTEGLSFGMFVLTVCGNLTYSSSILLESTEKSYLLNSLPYLVGSVGTLGFDLLVWVQFFMYGQDPQQEEYDVEDVPPPPQYKPKTVHNLRSNYYGRLGVERPGPVTADAELPVFNEFGEKIDLL